MASRLPGSHRGQWLDAGLMRSMKGSLTQTQRPREGTHRRGHYDLAAAADVFEGHEKPQATGGRQAGGRRQKANNEMRG